MMLAIVRRVSSGQRGREHLGQVSASMDGMPEDMLGLEESQGQDPLSTCLCLKGVTMRRLFTLEYWRDGDWYVGRLMEVPGVFSQGESLDELRENIQEAYELMVTQDRTAAPPSAERQDVELEV